LASHCIPDNLHIAGSTQDEYGTAAYKMVELDDKLKRAAVEHRETQGHESEKFCSYFNNVTYLEGGVESGFNHVEPDKEHPQLYHIKGNRRAGTLRLTQEPLRKDAMNSGDVFILTTGASEVYLWVGKSANMDEKAKGVEVAQGFCNKGKFQTLDEGANDSPTQAPGFWKHIQSEVSMLGPLKRKVTIQDADDKDDKGSTYTPALYRTPDSVGGSLVKAATAVMTPTGPTKEKRPKLSRGYLQEGNAYLLDTGFHVYIWLGSKSKAATRNNAVHYAHSYFKSHKRPTLSVTVVKSKHETEGFQLYFVDGGGGSGCACAIL
jgi:gelsolin